MCGRGRGNRATAWSIRWVRARAFPAILLVALAGFAFGTTSSWAVAATPNADTEQSHEATIAQVEAYLNSIKTFAAKFTQVDPKGIVSTGTFYLERPGRLRFDYNPPTPLLLVCDGFWLVLYDRQLKQANRWPVSETPLGLLVADKIRLSGKVKVTEIQRKPGTLRLTVIDTEKPGQGSLTLTFQTPDLELRNWRVVDAQGGETNVTFTDVRQGVTLKPDLFQFDEPVAFGNGEPHGR